MVSRAGDWLRQALRDLEHAEKSVELGDYEWACFASHQAAEKAVKALYNHLGIEVWSHSVTRMLRDLPDKYRPSEDFIDIARKLDRHYIPARYPNFHSEGAPLDYYSRDDAERAVEYARRIVEFCKSKILQT